MFDQDAIVDYLATLAINNGEAYKKDRDVLLAIEAAEQQVLKELRAMVKEASQKARQIVNEDWFEDEIKAAKSDGYTSFFKGVDAGETVAVQPHVYDYYYELLPPVGLRENGFFFAEGDDRQQGTGKRLVYNFFRQQGNYFCQRITI